MKANNKADNGDKYEITKIIDGNYKKKRKNRKKILKYNEMLID